jgi:hypothetical protein
MGNTARANRNMILTASRNTGRVSKLHTGNRNTVNRDRLNPNMASPSTANRVRVSPNMDKSSTINMASRFMGNPSMVSPNTGKRLTDNPNTDSRSMDNHLMGSQGRLNPNMANNLTGNHLMGNSPRPNLRPTHIRKIRNRPLTKIRTMTRRPR